MFKDDYCWYIIYLIEKLFHDFLFTVTAALFMFAPEQSLWIAPRAYAPKSWHFNFPCFVYPTFFISFPFFFHLYRLANFLAVAPLSMNTTSPLIWRKEERGRQTCMSLAQGHSPFLYPLLANEGRAFLPLRGECNVPLARRDKGKEEASMENLHLFLPTCQPKSLSWVHYFHRRNV